MNDIQEYSTAAVVTGPVTVGQSPAPVSFVFDAGLLPLIPGTGSSGIAIFSRLRGALVLRFSQMVQPIPMRASRRVVSSRWAANHPCDSVH
jgi:hypothetical protein